MRNKKMLLLSCKRTWVFSLSVFIFIYSVVGHSYNLPTKKIAIGDYDHKRLFVLTSNNNDQAWSYSNNIRGVPEDFSRPNLVKLQCQDQSCVAIGYYLSNLHAMWKEFILSSNDGGQSWNFIDTVSGTPAEQEWVEVYDMSCGGNTCAIVGEVLPNHLLFLLASSDKGQTWQYVNNIANMLPDLKIVHAPSVSCKDNTCVVASTGYDKTKNVPLLIVNNLNNKGIEDWTLVDISAQTTPRSLLDSLNCLNSIFCLDHTTCIAEATYFRGGSWLQFLMTKDSGKTWHFVQHSILPKGVESDDVFNKPNLYCSNNLCLATTVLRSNDLSHPLIMKSVDQGNSWTTFVENVDGLPEASVLSLHSTSCVENTCFIPGVYLNPDHHVVLFLLRSRDGGNTWDKVSNFPANAGIIEGIDCTGQSCSAVGSTNAELPALWTSDDRGKSWQSMLPDLPAMQTGELLVVTHN